MLVYNPSENMKKKTKKTISSEMDRIQLTIFLLPFSEEKLFFPIFSWIICLMKAEEWINKFRVVIISKTQRRSSIVQTKVGMLITLIMTNPFQAGFEFKVLLLLDWLPSKAKGFCLPSNLTHSWKKMNV